MVASCTALLSFTYNNGAAKNAFSDLPLGFGDGGIFSAVWPETLHQMQKGLMERGIELLVEMINEHSGHDGAKELDSRIQKIPMSRQSERLAFPLSTFPNGITNLTKIMGQEYPSLLLQVISVLASDKKEEILPRDQSYDVIAALDGLYHIWILLDQESHVLEHVKTDYITKIKK